jgi:hypothetical protein
VTHFTLNLGARVLLGLGAVGILLGATAAMGARRYPLYQARLERWGGGLLIVGLSLIGLAIPML